MREKDMSPKSRESRKAFCATAAAAVCLAGALALAGCAGGGDDGSQEAISEEDAAWVESYGQAEEELLGILSANAWSNADKTATLSFSDSGATVAYSDGASAQEESFVIADLEAGEQSDALVVSVGGQLRPASFVRYSEATETGSDMSLVVYGAFSSDVFYRVASSHALSVTGTPAWTSAFGVEGAEVEAALGTYISESFPAVTSAVFSGTAQVDEASGLLMLDYTLDNASSTTLTVSVSTDTGEVEQVNG